MSFLEIDKLEKSFGAARVLKGVSLEIEEGGFLVLVGPSGCGKSTLLNTIAGLEPITSGEIRIRGKRINELHPSRRDIAMVFQSYALYPNMTVGQNIAFGMEIRGVPKRERDKAVADVAGLLQIGHLLDRKPSQLSGGQRQRVALARSLAKRPKVLLLDEPLGALDLKLRENMQEELKSLQKALGITFVFVTHDQGEALSMADRVAVFNDGRIMQVGTPEDIYQRPSTRFVADFVGSSNVLPPDFVQRYSGQHRWGSLRPESIRVGRAASGDGVAARVVSSNYLGATTRLLLDADGLKLHAMVPAGISLPEPGEAVMLTFNRDQLHLMDEPA